MKITLKTLPQATAQQVFDQVARHLLTQGRKSIFEIRGTEVCQYRGPGGLMCAAGCLVADDEYIGAMEGKGWASVVEIYGAPPQHKDLIRQLQHVHDRSTVGAWHGELYEVAHVHNLSPAVLEEFEP